MNMWYGIKCSVWDKFSLLKGKVFLYCQFWMLSRAIMEFRNWEETFHWENTGRFCTHFSYALKKIKSCRCWLDNVADVTDPKSENVTQRGQTWIRSISSITIYVCTLPPRLATDYTHTKHTHTHTHTHYKHYKVGR